MQLTGGRHTGFARHEVLAGGPGSLSLSFGLRLIRIDGTISEHPEFFAVLSSALRTAGHRVVVLTYRDPARAEATNAQLAAYDPGKRRPSSSTKRS